MFSLKSYALILLFFLNNISYGAARDTFAELEGLLNGAPSKEAMRIVLSNVPWESSPSKAVAAGALTTPAQRNSFGPWVLYMIQSGGASTLGKIVKIPDQVEAAQLLLEGVKRIVSRLGREKEEADERARKSLEDQARIQAALDEEKRARAEEKALLDTRIAAQAALLSERDATCASLQEDLERKGQEHEEQIRELENQLLGDTEVAGRCVELEMQVKEAEDAIERLMVDNERRHMQLEDERAGMCLILEGEKSERKYLEWRLKSLDRLYQSAKQKLTEIYDSEINESLKKMLSTEKWDAYKDLTREEQLAYRKDFFSEERTEARKAQREKAAALGRERVRQEGVRDIRERLVRKIGSVAALEERDASGVYEENRMLRGEVRSVLIRLESLENAVKEAMRVRDLAQAEKRMVDGAGC